MASEGEEVVWTSHLHFSLIDLMASKGVRDFWCRPFGGRPLR